MCTRCPSVRGSGVDHRHAWSDALSTASFSPTLQCSKQSKAVAETPSNRCHPFCSSARHELELARGGSWQRPPHTLTLPCAGNVRPGDWTCPGCSANVFASKSTCFRSHPSSLSLSLLPQPLPPPSAHLLSYSAACLHPPVFLPPPLLPIPSLLSTSLRSVLIQVLPRQVQHPQAGGGRQRLQRRRRRRVRRRRWHAGQQRRRAQRGVLSSLRSGRGPGAGRGVKSEACEVRGGGRWWCAVFGGVGDGRVLWSLCDAAGRRDPIRVRGWVGGEAGARRGGG